MTTSPGFTIPDRDEAYAADPQSLWMQTDIDAILRGLWDGSVKSGCAVTPQGTPNMTVAVASGTVLVAGVPKNVAGGNVDIGTADASHPRIDCVVADATGAKQVRAGVPAQAAKMPQLTAGDVLLAAVLVPPGATSIIGSYITDKRVFNLWSVNDAGEHVAGDDLRTRWWISLDSDPASSGDPLKQTGRLQLKSHYWDGAASQDLDARFYGQAVANSERVVLELETRSTPLQSTHHFASYARAGATEGTFETDALRATHDVGGGIAVRGGFEFYDYNLATDALAGSPSKVSLGATIGLKNNARIRARNAADSADIDLLYLDTNNRAHMVADLMIQGSNLIVGDNAAAAGRIRIPNNDWLTGRNAANSADVNMWRVSTANRVQLGAELDINAQNVVGIAALYPAGGTPANTGFLRMPQTYALNWRNAGNTGDIGITANASDQLAMSGFTGLLLSGYIQGTEQSAPAAPPANGYRLFAEDNGSGKTRLMVQFATGTPQQIAIEP